MCMSTVILNTVPTPLITAANIQKNFGIYRYSKACYNRVSWLHGYSIGSEVTFTTRFFVHFQYKIFYSTVFVCKNTLYQITLPLEIDNIVLHNTVFFWIFLKILFIISDCSLPFEIGIRTNNEDRKGQAAEDILGQSWKIEESSIQARGLCLNFIQKPCN